MIVIALSLHFIQFSLLVSVVAVVAASSPSLHLSFGKCFGLLTFAHFIFPVCVENNFSHKFFSSYQSIFGDVCQKKN